MAVPKRTNKICRDNHIHCVALHLDVSDLVCMLTLDDVLKPTYHLGVGVGAGMPQAGEGVSITLALRAHSLT